jgi:hypothetical protein
MGASGNLKTMLPGELLQWLSLGQKTGTLTVSNGTVEKRIYFRAGRVISSASNDPREYLGQFLISHGFLSQDELMKAMEVQQQSGILLGKILVMIEAISEDDLQRLMRVKAEEEIYEIFLWPDGEFAFSDDELLAQEMIPLQIDVTGIIMEGSRRVDEWSRIRDLVPNDRVVPIISKKIDRDDLDEVQSVIVDAIDGRRTVAEIAAQTRASRFVVSATLHSLMRRGYARLAQATRRVDGDSEAGEVAALLQRADDALTNGDFETAQRLLKEADTLDSNHPHVRQAIKNTEAVILASLQQHGLHEGRVPRVAKPLEEITQMDFSPNEGFILSRVNGLSDIGSLLKVSPIREADAMLILYKLWKDDVIAME